MPTIVFWNVGRKKLSNLVARLARDLAADIVILAESPQTSATLQSALSKATKRQFYGELCQGISRVRVFFSLPRSRVRQVYETKHHITYRFEPAAEPPFCLMGLHLRSKLHIREDSQTLASTTLRAEILEVERLAGTTRTLILGDFNMNPFESGMVGAQGLHAVMDLGLARRGSRTINGNRYEFFYNPMWSLMGDRSPGPVGSYYRSSGEPLCFHWNVLDQVLLRPAVLKLYELADLRILDSIGPTSLVSKARRLPHKKYSDHLPLAITLKKRS